MHYRLIKAFGNFLVGSCLTDRTVKLLELGGGKDDEIVSEMPLMFRKKKVKEMSGQVMFNIESTGSANFALEYEV